MIAPAGGNIRINPFREDALSMNQPAKWRNLLLIIASLFLYTRRRLIIQTAVVVAGAAWLIRKSVRHR